MKAVLFCWRWLVFVALLFGLGCGLHGWFGPVERWSLKLTEDEWLFSFSADGAYLITHPVQEGDHGEWTGPFRKRDAFTGELLAEMSASGILYEDHSQSTRRFRSLDVTSRNRYWSALPKMDRGTLALFDFETGKEYQLPIEPHADYRTLIMSPREDMVAVCHERDSVPEDEIIRTHDIVIYAIPSG